jgi:hypothetical protein
VLDLSQSDWLAALVDQTIAAYDPAAARLKLPPELRSADPEGPSVEARARMLLVRSIRPRVVDAPAADPLDAFVRPLRDHVALLFEIALVFDRPFEPARRRAEVAMMFAALAGDGEDAVAADPAQPHRRSAAGVRRAFALAAASLVERCWPPGDPRGGLPLRAGLLCIERRQFGRLAIDYYGCGRLDETMVRRRLAQARHERLVLFEALAAASAPLERLALRASLRQLGRLDLPKRMRRRARESLAMPRSGDRLAQSIHAPLRPFVLEQLLLANLAGGASAGRDAFVERFAAAAGVGRDEVAALQADAVLHATEQRWIEPPATPADAALAGEWQESAEQMLERLTTAFSENVDALVLQLRQTGELGQLLAKAAAGHTLRDGERAKVKAHLIDVAKAVPALAIFAAPGGMLLLPLLAKVLPFNVLPSAWDHARTPLQKVLPPAPAPLALPPAPAPIALPASLALPQPPAAATAATTLPQLAAATDAPAAPRGPEKTGTG